MIHVRMSLKMERHSELEVTPEWGGREMVFIVLTMAVLHDLEIKAVDVLNSNVTATNKEKIWTVLGLSLETLLVSLSVKVLLILKLICSSFRSHTVQCINAVKYHFFKQTSI